MNKYTTERYDDDGDSDLGYLEKYTQNQVFYIPDDVIKNLLYDYPVTKKTLVYRGLNFLTQDERNSFLKSISYKNGLAILNVNGYASTTPIYSTARQFSVTRPSYDMAAFYDDDFKKSHQRKSKMGDYMSGYGVILKMQIQPNQGIDVSASGVAKESEILILTGEYKCRVELVDSYETQLIGVDKNAEVLKMRSLFDKRADDSIYAFILRNHNPELTDKSRHHIWLLYENYIKKLDRLYTDEAVQIEAVDKYDSRRDLFDVLVYVHYYPSVEFYWNILTPADKKSTSAYFNQQLKKINIELSKLYHSDTRYGLTGGGDRTLQLHRLGVITDDKQISLYKRYVKEKLAIEYRKMTTKSEIDKINALPASEQRDAIAKYTKDMVNLLKQIA